MNIKGKIKSIRAARSLTQEELARATGLSKESIKIYENKDNNITIKSLVAICRALDVDVGYMLDEEQELGGFTPCDTAKIGARIRGKREELGLKQKELELKASVGKNLVGRYEQSISNPTVQNLSALASALSCSISYLAGRDALATASQRASMPKPHDDMVTLPYYSDVHASAGGGSEVYGLGENAMSVSRDFLQGALGVKDARNLHIINSMGNSMEPTIEEHSLLICEDHVAGEGICDGSVYVLHIGGDLYVKRVAKNPATQSLRLISDNKSYEDTIIDTDNLKDTRIMGRVIGVIKAV